MPDPYNPSAGFIRAWAADPGAMQPVEDWDLMLEGLPCEDLYLGLAADAACPNRAFFLAVLYLKVGNAVRTDFRTAPEPAIRALLGVRLPREHPSLGVWRQRSRHLLAHPETFEYDLWCAGGLARQDAP